MTFANKVSFLLPKFFRNKLRQPWHNIELLLFFLFSGGRIYYNAEVGNIYAIKPLLGSNLSKKLPIVARSLRELKRWMSFGRDESDKLYTWLLNLKCCEILWDIGSANGLEGFMVNFLHGSRVVFVEPFTPSIESILKTNFLLESVFNKKLDIEIIQAACDEKKGFEKLVNHTKPVPGETFNSVENAIGDYCDGGRQEMEKKSFQWIKKITLDEILLDLKIQAPTHLKIDVDGLELRVLKGGKKLFNHNGLIECAIEVNDNNPKAVESYMKNCGFVKFDEHVHHNFGKKFTADFFF